MSVQLVFTALSNGYIKGYMAGGLYQGWFKGFCLPGLNCYSCPGAFGSCPIGALQAVIGSRTYQFSFYTFGFLTAIGALCGRLVCGFMCPFGFFQDLLHKIPLKKIRRIPFIMVFDKFRYAVLAIFVCILPAFAVNFVGQGDPWFCKYLCPSGTLMAGVPQILLHPELQSAAGMLWMIKFGVLLLLILLSVKIYRPFCRFLCPLGAVYGLFNRVSLYHYEYNALICTRCGACAASCAMKLDPCSTPNSTQCIRCGNCLRACQAKALSSVWSMKDSPHSYHPTKHRYFNHFSGGKPR